MSTEKNEFMINEELHKPTDIPKTFETEKAYGDGSQGMIKKRRSEEATQEWVEHMKDAPQGEKDK